MMRNSSAARLFGSFQQISPASARAVELMRCLGAAAVSVGIAVGPSVVADHSGANFSATELLFGSGIPAAGRGRRRAAARSIRCVRLSSSTSEKNLLFGDNLARQPPIDEKKY